MDVLAGAIQGIFGAAFGAFYLDGTLHQATRTDEDDGDVLIVYDDVPMKYQPDRITEAMRRAEGFTDKDAAFIVLQAGISPPLDTDAQFTAKSGPSDPERRWVVRTAESDPAGSHWIVRASPV